MNRCCDGMMKEEAKQLNGLFERIYSESNPDVRRAMNKSFTESGILQVAPFTFP